MSSHGISRVIQAESQIQELSNIPLTDLNGFSVKIELLPRLFPSVTQPRRFELRLTVPTKTKHIGSATNPQPDRVIAIPNGSEIPLAWLASDQVHPSQVSWRSEGTQSTEGSYLAHPDAIRRRYLHEYTDPNFLNQKWRRENLPILTKLFFDHVTDLISQMDPDCEPPLSLTRLELTDQADEDVNLVFSYHPSTSLKPDKQVNIVSEGGPLTNGPYDLDHVVQSGYHKTEFQSQRAPGAPTQALSLTASYGSNRRSEQSTASAMTFPPNRQTQPRDTAPGWVFDSYPRPSIDSNSGLAQSQNYVSAYKSSTDPFLGSDLTEEDAYGDPE